VELDTPRDPGDELSVEALLEAASDLGMEPSTVHRAVAEERAGLLDPHTSALDRLAGPQAISASRVVAGPLEEAMGLLDEWLRRAWAFKRVRGADFDVLYRRRTDPVAAIQRASRSVTGKENADKVRRIRAMGHAVDPHRTWIAVVVDLQTSRTAAQVGGASVGGAGALVSALTALGSTPWLWLGVPASAAAGVGVMATRRAWTHGIEDEIQGLLDNVASGSPPPAVLGELGDRLLGERLLGEHGRRNRTR
jgi:ribosomal protein L18